MHYLRRRLLVGLLVVFSLQLYAQSTNSAASALNHTTSDESIFVLAPRLSEVYSAGVLIVPYELHMYQSFIDDEIQAGTNLDKHGVKQKIKETLVDQLQSALEARKKDWGVMQLDSDYFETYEDLLCLRESLSYRYKSVSSKVSKPKKKKKRRKRAKKKRMGGQMYKPSGRSKRSGGEKFMASKLGDTEFLEYLEMRYNADFLFMINQLDIRKVSKKTREMTVHYSIIDMDGNDLFGAKISVSFNGTNSSPEVLKEGPIQDLVYLMTAELPKVKKSKNVPNIEQ